jgi:hypothetical protein
MNQSLGYIARRTLVCWQQSRRQSDRGRFVSRKGSALINFFLNFSTYAINLIEKVNVKFTPVLFNVVHLAKAEG